MSETELSIELRREDYLIIDQLDDLFALAPNPKQSIQSALEIILDSFNRTGGALFIQTQQISILPHWVRSGVPIHWENQLEDPYSQLNSIARNAIEKRKILAGDILPDIAAVFPIVFNDQPFGALLVWGKVISPDEYAKWQAFLKPVGRAISAFQLSQSAHRIKDVLALQSMSNLQIAKGDIDQIEFNTVQGIKEFFEAEEILLVLIDEENPSLAVKKQLGSGQIWKNQASFKLEVTQLSQSLAEGSILKDQEVWEVFDQRQCMEGIQDINLETVIGAPLNTNERTLGAVILLNPILDASEIYRRNLLMSMTTSLAVTIYNARQISRLKISIADLEATRWEILNSRNTLRVFFDNIPASVYIVDRSYSMVAINFRRSSRVNQHPKDLVGKKCYDELFSRSDPCPGCRVFDTFNTGKTTTRNSREWLDQEKYIDWEITTFPIQESMQFPHQVIIFEVDVTEKRSLETNLIQSEKLAAVGQLAAGVAHEINNPLAAIIANAQILQREISNADPDVMESLKLIETAGIRASQVISNLLGLAHKEKKYEFEAFSLNETIEAALSLVKHEVNNRSIKVNLALSDNMPEIIASKSHLQGVWINLIINSMDAIQRPDGEIAITSAYVNKEFKVIVTDNGKGIPQTQISRIFEPFYTTKSVGKGTGLGLSVCLRVIKEHMGNIQVESQPEQGTKFTVILPDINRNV
jgi:two-component system, NtrC family, sensor kinase